MFTFPLHPTAERDAVGRRAAKLSSLHIPALTIYVARVHRSGDDAIAPAGQTECRLREETRG